MSTDAPIRPFPSRRKFEPKYLAEILGMPNPRSPAGPEIHARMVDEPLRLEYERAVAALRLDDLPVVIGDTVGEWLFSCPAGAQAEAICRAVGMTRGLYADLRLRGPENEELLIKRFNDTMPRRAFRWPRINDVIRMVIGDCQSVVFIFRGVESGSARLVGRFGLYVKESIEELLPLKGPIAMVLEGWEEPFLECVADAHTPSLKHSIRMSIRALSMNRPGSTG